MKKQAKIFVAFAMSLMLILTGVTCFGSDAVAPELKAITFKNATIDTAFKSDVLEYTITLKDNTVSPTLESFESTADCELFVTYITDDAGHQTGIKASLNNSTGSGVNYVFHYSNPAEFVPNSNNYLADIYSTYAELEKPLNHEDTSYKLYIPKDLTNLKLTPVTEDVNASCPQLEQLTLSSQKITPITLTCTASDGTTRSYKIKLKRVDKTVEQVKAEMQEEGYTSFVSGTHFYESDSFFVIAGASVGGVIVLFLLYKLIRRFGVNPYDAEEKPFYSTVD